MAKVKGTYTFKDELTTFPFGNEVIEEVAFTFWNNKSCLGICISIDGITPDTTTLVYNYDLDDPQSGHEAYWYHDTPEWDIEKGWVSDIYKTIDFGETEQEVSDEFYAWLVENTVGGAVPETIEINITENGTTTLATAGKYCDRNIDVNVAVPVPEVSHTSLLDGTISGEFVDDKVTYLKYAVFQNCTNLTHIFLPNCVEANSGYTFNNCTKVETIHLPKLETLSSSAARVFYSMNKVKEIDLPSLTTAPNMSSTFEMDREVEIINMPNLSGTSFTRTFYNCYKLHTLVLGGSTLNTMANTNALTNAGTQTTTGTGLRIYVPDDMVDAYKTATNWTAYADKIKPMSELEG